MSEREQRAANQVNISLGPSSLSGKDLGLLLELYEENKRAAIARALEGMSLDPRTWHRPLSLLAQLSEHPSALLPPPLKPLPPPPAPG